MTPFFEVSGFSEGLRKLLAGTPPMYITVCVNVYTPPKTNISHLKIRWLEDDPFLLGL